MRKIVLMRHAKSSWGTPSLSDHDRPLNARGRRSALALGDWLRARNNVPDETVTSSSQRTRETYSGLGIDGKVTVSPELYQADTSTIFEVLRRSNAMSVLVLGHNPGLGDFAHRILGDPFPHPRFADYPTGATLVATFNIASWAALEWQSGTAIDFTVPRDLVS